jgi:hypothetical protein
MGAFWQSGVRHTRNTHPRVLRVDRVFSIDSWHTQNRVSGNLHYSTVKTGLARRDVAQAVSKNLTDTKEALSWSPRRETLGW